jgi:hypothetical protein
MLFLSAVLLASWMPPRESATEEMKQLSVQMGKLDHFILDNIKLVIHLGWPMSSWFERLSIGAMIYNLMKLPRLFPNFDFDIEYRFIPFLYSNLRFYVSLSQEGVDLWI